MGKSVCMCCFPHVRQLGEKFFPTHALNMNRESQYFCMNMFVELVTRIISVNESITLKTAPNVILKERNIDLCSLREGDW